MALVQKQLNRGGRAAREAPAGGEGRRAVSGTRRRPRVLLVEDERMVRRALTRMLTSLGFEVHEATCGSDAMEVFEALPEPASKRGRGRIDLLVTDLMMPDGSGRSLATRLRRLLPTLPVLFVSGFDSQSAGAWEGECCSFLTKPFRSAELESVVAKLMGDTPRGV